MTATAATRRRVRVSAPGTVEVVTEAVPEPGPGEVLVSFRVAGVCGSDLHGLHGKHPAMPPPFYPGHEVVGTVLAGECPPGIWVGQLVTVEPPLPCGYCKMCSTGRSNICSELEFFGCGFREGGMADTFTVRADRLHPVPDGFTLRQAALIEPLATPVHAVELAGGVAGKAVAIIGCGTIGLLTLAAARAGGARRVVMTDLLAAKRDIALASGAEAVVDAAAPDAPAAVKDALGETADVVFDCVSAQPTVRSAIDMVERGGTVVLLGVPSGPLEVPAFTLQDRQIRLQGSATYQRADFEKAIRILGGDYVSPDRIITSAHPIRSAAGAFAAAESGDQVKVLITADDVSL
ncbi:zinc-binding dehydrogenase [Streptomyces sp. MMS24-I2-30]|uniref:zinc-dependent alcohol dehydrogenase n=1 Tax=Streptomyces sp. MMS24-I2-30 TaxID=3351564 RepID=UPI003896E009